MDKSKCVIDVTKNVGANGKFVLSFGIDIPIPWRVTLGCHPTRHHQAWQTNNLAVAGATASLVPLCDSPHLSKQTKMVNMKQGMHNQRRANVRSPDCLGVESCDTHIRRNSMLHLKGTVLSSPGFPRNMLRWRTSNGDRAQRNWPTSSCR